MNISRVALAPLSEQQRTELFARLVKIVGASHVLVDDGSRRFGSTDLFAEREPVLVECVVRPNTTEETAAVVRILQETTVAVIPRAAGLSYAGGAVAYLPAVAVDTRRLDQIAIQADDFYAVIGAGCTWAQVAAALKPHGLRAAQPSPMSGSHSTVGGTVAQALPGGLDGVIGLTAVLADGTIVRTGSGARIGTPPFFRYGGPDLTGIFLGDCGAFGVKTEIVLRCVPARPTAFASFAFATREDAIDALCAVAGTGLIPRALILDPMRNQQIGQVSAATGIRTLAKTVQDARGWQDAIGVMFRAVRYRRQFGSVPWSLHLAVEAATTVGADGQIDLVRPLCLRRGREIDDLLPRSLHANPYSNSGMLGTNGRRWVPVHGVLPPSRAKACFLELLKHTEGLSADLQRLDIAVGWLIAANTTSVTIESMFYWHDALDAVHLAHVPQGTSLPAHGVAINRPARDFVARVRREHRDIMDVHGAVHTQVGRLYQFAANMDHGSHELMVRLKDALDAGRQMNPGVLGLN